MGTVDKVIMAIMSDNIAIVGERIASEAATAVSLARLRRFGPLKYRTASTAEY